jgi:hypothetical protein
MEALFASGHAVDIVLIVLAVEAVLLKLRGNRWADIIPALLPAALMAWPFISLPLALAFPVHLYDLHRRRMLAAQR